VSSIAELTPTFISNRQVDWLQVETYDSPGALGAASAASIIHNLVHLLKEREKVRMVFAAAPSQANMLARLVQHAGLEWNRVTMFNMDEFIGLPSDAPQRFGNWLGRNLFDFVPGSEVHLLNPERDAMEEAERYAALLEEAPIDIVCLGIGVNGHIAFNDPDVADFNDAKDVKVVELDHICRQQQLADQAFDSLESVPTHALTLTIPRLLRAGHLFCIVPGSHKAEAVRNCLTKDILTSCPASILRTHKNCTLYLDKDSDQYDL
jgi:glucosamine-6-phosphate deaminase